MNRKALALAAATLAFGAAPFLTPPFTGYDPATFPVVIPRPAIQPAGYAFSIWGLIYLWLFVHAAFGLFRRAEDPAWDAVRWPLAASIALGSAWLWIAQSAPILATIGIFAMLAGALLALWRAPATPDRWLLLAPISIYAGWLTAASSVSLGVVVAGYGGLSDTASAAAMLVLALTIAIPMQRAKPHAPGYGLTVIWALIAVAVVNAGDNRLVMAAAIAGVAAMAANLATLRRS